MALFIIYNNIILLFHDLPKNYVNSFIVPGINKLKLIEVIWKFNYIKKL